MAKPDDPKILAAEYGNTNDCDVFFYNGATESPHDTRLIRSFRKRKKRPNLLVILVTPGGDAHVAFRIARCFQRNYENVTIYVPGWCKSAGTLLVMGAHELFMGDEGELGPIDVQSPKPDELWESSSGLTEEAALTALKRAATEMFEDFLFEIKNISGGQITFKTAAEVAVELVTGVFSPIYAQIDPFKIGENSRAVSIARDYGIRLARVSRNLKGKVSVEHLTTGYSSHAFVIDREEAEQFFINISPPPEELEFICECMGETKIQSISDGKPRFEFLNPEVEENLETGDNVNEKSDTSTRGNGDGPDARPAMELGGDSQGTDGPPPDEAEAPPPPDTEEGRSTGNHHPKTN